MTHDAKDAKALLGIALAFLMWGVLQHVPGYQPQGAAFVVAGVMSAMAAEACEDITPAWFYEVVIFIAYPALVGVGIGLATAR